MNNTLQHFLVFKLPTYKSKTKRASFRFGMSKQFTNNSPDVFRVQFPK